MKKVLFTATVDSHILHFHTPYLKYFKDNGYEVHIATNGNEIIPFCDVKHVITFERSPFKLNNLKAIKELKKIIDKEQFDIIHTHTPMGSVVTRLAAINSRKKGTRVIYTAHGFHFYKGAPIIYWLLFYPIEKYLSRFTDTLITINKEDYEIAKKNFKKTNVEYVPGVGIDESKFNFTMTEEEKQELRSSIGLKPTDFVLIYPAELNKNKNQIFLINVMEQLVKENPNIHLLLPGKDSLNGKYQSITKEKGLGTNIHFIGYRNDIPRLLKISNIAVSSSKREGLGLNLLEAIFSGIPVVAFNNRGHNEIIVESRNGYFANSEKKFQIEIDKIINHGLIVETKITEKYYLYHVLNYVKKIYSFK
jgi:glycosyltransferase EpsD